MTLSSTASLGRALSYGTTFEGKIKMQSSKVIISCAITGAVHTPSLSPYLPITPAEIAQQAVEAAEAGAAILHLHARNPDDGRPTGDPEIFARFLPVIKQQTDAVINITTGGSPEMTIDERLAASLRFQPEMCSLNMGSMNLSFHRMGQKVDKWKYPWEKQYIANSESIIFKNSFKDISRIYEMMADFGTRYEHECFDIGHLYNLAYFLDAGLVKPPLFIQSVFGILGGIGADPDNVVFMRRTADRLFGDEYIWSVLAAGRHQMPIALQGAMLGGNVRVGLEDSLYLRAGELATSSAAQVRKIVMLLEELGLEPASPAETRAMLDLKGSNRVKF